MHNLTNEAELGSAEPLSKNPSLSHKGSFNHVLMSPKEDTAHPLSKVVPLGFSIVHQTELNTKVFKEVITYA
jgi:hypothetical protein